MEFAIRAMREDDRRPAALLYAAVAEERTGIGAEPPVDIERRAARFDPGSCILAEANGEVVGLLHLDATGFGYGEIGMFVAGDWRGRGVGSALVEAAIALARELGLHKLSLSVFTHNETAIALYRKFGFVEEGRRVKQFRRTNGELWDSYEMGLLL